MASRDAMARCAHTNIIGRVQSPALNRNGAIGVIFDMDGVLVDSARPHFRSWQRLALENGIAITEAQFTGTFGRQNRDIIPLLFGPVTAKRLGTLADRKEELYRDLVRAEPPIMTGAIDLVRSLHRLGARLAVGSSGPIENIELIVEAMAVGPCFDAIVSGEDVTRGKPDPEVFILAAERLGLPASRCVVVEDAPVGIEAAKAAGAKAIGIATYHPAASLGTADLVVDALADLRADAVLTLARGLDRPM